jgi:hypothetical protein
MAIQITPDIETSLLIHSDEVEGSTSFKDSSTYGHTVTATGNIHHDTETTIGGGPGKFGRSSMFSDGDDYLTIADHSSFDFGYGDFTIDFWLRLNSAGGNKNYIARRGDGYNDSLWFFRTENGPQYQFYWNDNSNNYNMLGGVPETNVWHHLAIVRRGRLVKMYEDGIVIDTHTETTPRSYDPGLEVLVGARYGGGVIQPLDGWIDEIRISKGIARWTDSFVPPNKPYSVIGGDAVTDISGIDDDGLGNTSFSDIVVRSDPSEASTDSIFSVNAKDGTALMDIRADGIITKPKQPAFGAKAPGGQNDLAHTTSVAVEFDEFYDQGGNFANDTFTAPVTGKYLLCFSLYLLNVDADATSLACTIKTSNRQYEVHNAPDAFMDHDDYISVTASHVCDMDASDTAYIFVYYAGGSTQMDIHGDSIFSGALIC